MVDHVRVCFTAAGDLHLRWDWMDAGEGEVPECRVFFTALAEQVLLERGLFLENEIMAYFREQLPFSLHAADVQTKMEQHAARNSDTCGFFSFTRNMNEREDRVVPVQPNLRTSIFLVCITDKDSLICRVMAPGGYHEIPFTVQTQGFFGKLFGKGGDRLAIKPGENDARMKVVRIGTGRDALYAALPRDADVYYFDPSVRPEQLKFFYLSSLVGMTDEGESSI